MTWLPVDGDRIHCDRHGQTFGKLARCEPCDADPGAGLEIDRDDERSPAAAADEQWCRNQRDAVLAIARDLATARKGRKAADRVGYSTVGKLYETALKFHRAAVEERRLDDDKAHERWLVRQARELAQRGAAH